ncbi:MAG: hypothetical protein IJK87_03265 [Prevotella sp.]|nr:hypothetical protein [Prevotella sp.]
MKILYRLMGLPMVIFGVAWLAICLLTGLSNYNTCLLIGTVLVILGIVMYIAKTKRKSPY